MCKKDRISHLCFMHDLMVFYYPNVNSIKIVKDVLDNFKKWSGFRANINKSSFFALAITKKEKEKWINILRCKERSLLVKYLRVPLITKKLSFGNCKPLIERILARVKSWRSKFLSYVGRLTLVKLVLWSIQVYWCFFFLPSKFQKEIGSILRAFP